jgi:C4-dicarboxylate-binding protein DctP
MRNLFKHLWQAGRECALVGAAALAAWAVAPGPAAGAAYTFKCSLVTINDVQHEFCKRYVARLEKRSNGQIKGQIFPAGQLGAIPRQIEGVQTGTIEIFVTPPDFLVGVDPRFQALSAPFLFSDMDHAYRAINDPEFLNRYLNLAEAKGIKGVALYPAAPASFVSRTPIRTPDDLKGKKFRVLATPIETALMAALGATGVPMPWGDTLPALQQGAVDGVEAGLTVLVIFKYFDVVKWHTNTDHYIIHSTAIVSKKWLDGLPAELQKAVVEEGPPVHAELLAWIKINYNDSVRIWKEKTKDGWIELTAEQRAAFRARTEGVDEKVARQVAGLNELIDLLRAKSKQHAK